MVGYAVGGLVLILLIILQPLILPKICSISTWWQLKLCFQLYQHTFASLGDQTGDYLLRHIFGRIIEQFFELDRAELLDDFFFAADRQRVLPLKLVQFSFLLEHVLDQTPSPIGHLTKAIPQSRPNKARTILQLPAVLNVRLVPNVVCHKLLHSFILICSDKIFLWAVERFDQARDVLNEYIIACDHNFLGLLLLRSCCSLCGRRAIWRQWRRGGSCLLLLGGCRVGCRRWSHIGWPLILGCACCCGRCHRVWVLNLGWILLFRVRKSAPFYFVIWYFLVLLLLLFHVIMVAKIVSLLP